LAAAPPPFAALACLAAETVSIIEGIIPSIAPAMVNSFFSIYFIYSLVK
jgi:hypothetical protein